MAITVAPLRPKITFYGLVADTKPTKALHTNLPEPEPGDEFHQYTADNSSYIIYFTPDGTNWYQKVTTI